MTDKQKNIIEWLLLALTFLVGGIVGSIVFPETKGVILSERQQSCEEKGGRYYYGYVDYQYREVCNVEEREIEDF